MQQHADSGALLAIHRVVIFSADTASSTMVACKLYNGGLLAAQGMSITINRRFEPMQEVHAISIQKG